MSFFEQYEANPADLSTAHALLHRMAQKVVRGGGEANQVWIDLLKDMLIIRDQVKTSPRCNPRLPHYPRPIPSAQVFTNIGDEFCYRLFCSTLLHTGRMPASFSRPLLAPSWRLPANGDSIGCARLRVGGRVPATAGQGHCGGLDSGGSATSFQLGSVTTPPRDGHGQAMVSTLHRSTNCAATDR